MSSDLKKVFHPSIYPSIHRLIDPSISHLDYKLRWLQAVAELKIAKVGLY